MSAQEQIGKGLALSLIKAIMGNNYYTETHQGKHIAGNFNSLLEGKILINLNEATWGGDIQQQGAWKHVITDASVPIENKGVDVRHNVEIYANFVITSNAGWIAAVDPRNERYFMVRCSDQVFEKAYYAEIAQTDVQELANFFYNREIQTKDFTKFKRTALHQEQVEMGFSRTVLYWQYCLDHERIYWKGEYDGQIKEDKCVMKLGERVSQSGIHRFYEQSGLFGAHKDPVPHNMFWTETWRIFPNWKAFHTGGRPRGVVKCMPLKDMRDMFNKSQNGNYFDDDDDDDDDE